MMTSGKNVAFGRPSVPRPSPPSGCRAHAEHVRPKRATAGRSPERVHPDRCAAHSNFEARARTNPGASVVASMVRATLGLPSRGTGASTAAASK